MRRISALPVMKPSDHYDAFRITTRAEGLEDEKLKDFTTGLIAYAQTKWRERFCVQIWLLVPSTNNGNKGANGHFVADFGVHPTFWSFILDACLELERVETDIPTILYSSLVPPTNSLSSSLPSSRLLGHHEGSFHQNSSSYPPWWATHPVYENLSIGLW